MPTRIQWADEVWNIVTGCTPVSEACDRCYARRMATRLRGRYGYPADEPFRVTLHHDKLNAPLKWRQPRHIFVSSMGDFFHPDVPVAFQAEALRIIDKCPQHTFLFLTKRPEQMRMFEQTCGGLNRPNVWLGVTAENQPRADERIPILLSIPAALHFVSVEPMLGPVDLSRHLNWQQVSSIWTGTLANGVQAIIFDPLRPLDWVICGGETGPGARLMLEDWAVALKDQCATAGVPFFFKSMGTNPYAHLWSGLCREFPRERGMT